MIFFILMGSPLKTEVGRKIFSRIFLKVALEEAAHNLDPEIFDATVFRRVSEYLGLDLQDVTSVHHSFYWELFNKKDAALTIAEPREKGLRRYIGFRNGSVDIDPLENSYTANWGDYLENRISGLIAS